MEVTEDHAMKCVGTVQWTVVAMQCAKIQTAPATYVRKTLNLHFAKVSALNAMECFLLKISFFYCNT